MSDWIGSLTQSFAEFRRRRVFRVAAAYIVVGWILIQVADNTFEPLGLPLWSNRLLIILLGLGFVLACALAWIFDIGAHGIERTPALAGQTVAAADSTQAPKASVAVLPFTDLSEAKDQGYFCDGLAEEILDALTRVRGLQVASRTSSFRFRDGITDAREIGRVLNVAAIMEGSVRRAGQRVRVTAQLVDVGNGYHLWSENFDRQLQDVFAIQEEIARAITRALSVSLKAPETLDLQRHAPRDMRAYELYLRGRQLQAQSTGTWTGAAEMFRQAIALDPDYAAAHAGLADAIAQLLIWRFVRPDGALLDEALAASRRALALAPDLAEAHVANACILSLGGNFDEATAAFHAAIALNPRLYEAHFYYARQCFACGLHSLAMQEFELAHQVRPNEFQSLRLAVAAATAVGDRVRADDFARRALECTLAETGVDPSNGRAHYFAAVLKLHLGDVAGGRQHIEIALGLNPRDFGTLYNAACFHALAGEPDRALDLLDQFVTAGHGYPDWLEHDPDLETLRELPRFREIMVRIEKPRR